MIKKLTDICSFISGNAWKSSEFADEGIPIIRINNLNTNDNDFVYWQGDYDKRYLINKGDLLVSLSGTIKTFRWNGPEALLNQRIVKVVANRDTNQDWVYYHISHVIEEIANKAKHAVIKNVSVNDLKNFEVDVPDYQVQNRIVAILDKASALVQKRQQTIDFLDELLRSQFLQIFQSDLLAIKKNATKLSDIATILSGLTKGRKTKETELFEVPYLRVANAQDGYFDLKEIKSIKATRREIEQYYILNKDILITEGGDSDKLGRGAVWEGEENKFIYQNHLFRIRLLKEKKYSAYWLIYLLSSAYGKYYFLRQAKQTTGIATINKSQVSNFPIPDSSFSLQEIFEKNYLAIRRLQGKLKNALEESKSFFNSIMQRAFAGKLNLNVSVEVDALLEEVDLQKIENDLFSIITNEEYLSNLVNRLNNQEFGSQNLYNKAKHTAFQLLKTEEILTQEYDKTSKSLKLVVK